MNILIRIIHLSFSYFLLYSMCRNQLILTVVNPLHGNKTFDSMANETRTTELTETILFIPQNT